MIWNNKKLNELIDKNNNEAERLYEDYEKKLKESNQNTNKEPDNTEVLYSKKENSPLNSYGIIIGDKLLPITPKNLTLESRTEEKKYKNIFGKELILGVVLLPKEVKFSSTFPYYKIKEYHLGAKEYVAYFESIKNQRDKVEFKIEGGDINFDAYITQFDYKLIPGRDIEFSITLKEALEVEENEIDI